MAIRILYVDLRHSKTIMDKFEVQWHENLTAENAVRSVLPNSLVQHVITDLQQNINDIFVSWYHPPTEEQSEIGGVGSLDWKIPDNSILTILYEDHTTTNQQRDISDDWLLDNSEIN